MSYPVDSLSPKLVWKYFDEIRKIPRGSRNEKQLADAIAGWASAAGCEARIDSALNMVVTIPATKGYENVPGVVLQGHLDMVCEKNSDKDFDFEKDAIVLKRDGDWITADGTTLGADNGIGVAMGLALLESPDLVHGPIELLCTTDEETGLNGANSLRPDFVKGRMLINLDSEEDAVFYVGCAGGRDTHLTLPLTRTEPLDGDTCTVTVKGLRGGHSGLDIGQNRGNALKLLARTLFAISNATDLGVVSLSGGDKHNAIPREATATIHFPTADRSRVFEIVETKLAGFRSEFAVAEPNLTIDVSDAVPADAVLTGDCTKEALTFLLAIPHGVVAMSRDLVGLVESSTNLARVRTEAAALTVLTSSRSSIKSAVDGIVDQLIAVGELAGADVEASEGYPGWKPNLNSELLAFAKEIWIEKYDSPPLFTAIHAGLECGIIGEKYPGMDMISFGPTIVGPHSPEERVSIPTVERCFDFLGTLLTAIAKKGG